MGQFKPGSGVYSDIKGRLPWYAHDWREGIVSGLRMLAPATYIFFASALPALAFGQQLNRETHGIVTGVQVLAATGVTGIVQAIFGGQPLLIVGVAEPIVLLYVFMYEFAEGQPELGTDLFLAWAAWVCVWTSLIIIVLALLNACHLISWFTRFSGELFGGLIAVLFAQEAIKGWKEQFQVEEEYGAVANQYQWRLVNGLWGLLLGLGLVLTAHFSRGARSWRFGLSGVRSLMADYGAPFMVLVWTLMSYALTDTPDGVPRRLPIPNTWDQTDFWSVSKDMGRVPGVYIGAALVPATIIAILFFFDHCVSAQLAQVPEFNLQKPSAYHYDFLLLAVMTLACGLLGLPPVNGVLPQAPLHTKSLATLRKEHVRAGLRRTAKEALAEHGARGGQPESSARDLVLQRMEAQAVRLQSRAAALIRKTTSVDKDLSSCGPEQQNGEGTPLHTEPAREGKQSTEDLTTFDVERELEQYLPVEVFEQRVSGLLQSFFVLLCLALTPVLQKIPSAVISGYFFFMALESLPGSQFWDRLLLLITDPKRRYMVLEQYHATYLETVRFRVILLFTLLQLLLMMGVWALTYFAGVAGSLFPLPILALIPIRIYVLPRLFPPPELEELDAKTWEEAPPLSHEEALQEQARQAAEASHAPSAEELEDEQALYEHRFSGFRIKHPVTHQEVQQRISSMRAEGPEEPHPYGHGENGQPETGIGQSLSHGSRLDDGTSSNTGSGHGDGAV